MKRKECQSGPKRRDQHLKPFFCWLLCHCDIELRSKGSEDFPYLGFNLAGFIFLAIAIDLLLSIRRRSIRHRHRFVKGG